MSPLCSHAYHSFWPNLPGDIFPPGVPSSPIPGDDFCCVSLSEFLRISTRSTTKAPYNGVDRIHVWPECTAMCMNRWGCRACLGCLWSRGSASPLQWSWLLTLPTRPVFMEEPPSGFQHCYILEFLPAFGCKVRVSDNNQQMHPSLIQCTR